MHYTWQKEQGGKGNSVYTKGAGVQRTAKGKRLMGKKKEVHQMNFAPKVICHRGEQQGFPQDWRRSMLLHCHVTSA